MPITVDNRYDHKHIPVTVEQKLNTTVSGVDMAICKGCGSLVLDTKQHNTWHKENDKT